MFHTIVLQNHASQSRVVLFFVKNFKKLNKDSIMEKESMKLDGLPMLTKVYILGVNFSLR